MYINLESDYAVRIILYLIREDKMIDAKKISNATGVTIKFVHKIMRKLLNNGIVESQKGSKGGYLLLKKPNEITLLEIIEMVEGEYTFSRCLSHDTKRDKWCDNKYCKVKNVYEIITKDVRYKLNSVKFSDLL